ncbi:MAG: ABC transporter ATP-binding protein [Clostridia bacterium]|nr:ABC transporter ATP-binding protein [Clostridia bacterium]
MIEIKGVTKKFGSFTAIENLSLKVGNGSVYGLVGYNGAGKTTLLKTIMGIYKADEGSITVDGVETFDSPDIKKKMFFAPDDLYFEPYSTINKMAKFYSGYYPEFSFETLEKLCKVFGLDKDKRINSFSKGMQRQAELILAISSKPEIILFDENFDGLDPAKRNLFNKMIIEYVAETDSSVIISSHNLHELTDICDHIGLINGKRIVLDCSVDDISASRCKFRLVFADEKTEDDFKDIPYKKFNKDGRIITLSMAVDAEEGEEILRKLNPLMIEKFPQTLEEIFLDEMEGSDYDFKEIFG